jgi:hypothetical protein
VKVVELRRRRPEDATIETLARIYVPDSGGPAIIEPTDPGELGWIQMLLDRGGVIGARGRALTLEDGEQYVDALPSSFRGSRLWAEELPDEIG